MATSPKPTFFKTAPAFETWLAKHHATRTELWVGLYKKHAATRGMTYPDAVDAALCWGWIDGVLKSIDGDRVMQRFTPRKSKSTWSLVNVGKVERLIAAGRMQAPGMAAFEVLELRNTRLLEMVLPLLMIRPPLPMNVRPMPPISALVRKA